MGSSTKEENRGAPLLTLTDLYPMPGSRKKRKRLGIGEGSGNGKTCGKGGKGQTMRSGASIPRGFEGGQMPLHRRLPKVGFRSRKRFTGANLFAVVSLDDIAKLDLAEINREVLVSSGLVGKSRDKIKILGSADLTKKLVIEAQAFSGSAKAAIEKAGGEAKVVPFKL